MKTDAAWRASVDSQLLELRSDVKQIGSDVQQLVKSTQDAVQLASRVSRGKQTIFWIGRQINRTAELIGRYGWAALFLAVTFYLGGHAPDWVKHFIESTNGTVK